MRICYQRVKILGLMLAAGLFSNQALSQQQSTATAATQAIVVMPIVITKSTDLYFGRLVSVVGTVSISAETGARTSTNSANLITTLGTTNAPGRATFTVRGEPGLAYDISATVPTITLINAAIEPLQVTLTGVHVLSTTGTGTAATATSGTLSALGSDTLGIGGSLTLADDTPSGTYAHSEGISLTVNYN